jgi:hypothetical protein
MDKIKVGSKVFVTRQPGWTAGGSDSYQTVTNIKKYYDKETGKEYPVVCIGDAEFHGLTGYPLTPPWAYMIAGLK